MLLQTKTGIEFHSFDCTIGFLSFCHGDLNLHSDSLKQINLQTTQGTNRHLKLIHMLYILLSSKALWFSHHLHVLPEVNIMIIVLELGFSLFPLVLNLIVIGRRVFFYQLLWQIMF